MSITVRCPECHATLTISERGKGEDVQCTRCRAVFRLPDDLGPMPTADSMQHSPVRSVQPARSQETRPQAEGVRLRADKLNNQAVSLLSLGKPGGADQLFEKVLRIVPNHPQATFNRDLLRWRTGRMTDLALVRELEELREANPGDSHPEYYLALIHAERGDIEAAIQHLKGSAVGGGEVEVQTTLQRLLPTLPQSTRCIKVLGGHTRVITAVHLSHDVRSALSVSWDGTVRLWDLAEGACVRIIDTQSEGCQSLAVTPDFRWALTGNGSLWLWDLASGDRVRAFEGHGQPVTSLALSADGAVALSGSRDQTVRLWQVATGRCLRTLEGHTAPIACACLSPDGRWALSGTSNRELWMWDVATGQRIRVFDVQEFGPECICLSRDGRWVLSGDVDAKVHLWSTKNGMRVRTLRGHTEKVTSVSLTADGRWALSGSLDETLRLWDVSSGCCVRTMEGHLADIFSVTLSPDGRWGLSGGSSPSDPRDNAVRLWDFGVFQRPGGRFMAPAARCVMAGREEAKPGQGRFNGMLAEARSLIAARRFEEAIYLVEQARRIPSFALNPQALELRHLVGEHGVRERFRDGRCTRMLRGPASAVGPVALSPDSSHALSGSSDKMVRLWDLAKGECECTLAGHAGPVNDVCFTPDGRQAISASEDGTLRVWDLMAGTCVRSLQGHTSWVSCVAVSPDGRFAISGGRDRTLRLWDLASGQCLRTYTGHDNLVRSVRISACARRALSGSFDKTMRLWDIATGRCLRTLGGHADIVHCVSMSWDGRWALSASNDKTIRLWDLAAGQCARVLQDHLERILAVAMTGAGRWAISGSGDKLLRLWNLATGQCAQVFSGHTGVVTSVALSPDGHWFISGSHDQTLRVWELEWDYAFPELADWDEGALPYLENFLTVHTPYQQEVPQGSTPSDEEVARSFIRSGSPRWSEDDVLGLVADLRRLGYGWLRPEGVRRKLEEMATQSQGSAGRR